MIYSTVDWTRFSTILITQGFLIFFFSLIIFNIIKRKRSTSSFILTNYFSCNIIGFILNIIYLPIKSYPLTQILHVTAVFMVIWAQSFLILFCLLLLKGDSFVYKGLLYLITSAIITLIVLNYPSGITLNEGTNWRPFWTLDFFYCLITYFIVSITIPIIYLEWRVSKAFHSSILKKRWKYFQIGSTFSIIVLYGGAFYIALDYAFFRSIYSIVSVLAVILAGIYLYFGIGKPISRIELLYNKDNFLKEYEKKEDFKEISGSEV